MSLFEVCIRILVGSFIAGVVAGGLGLEVVGMVLGMYFVVTAIGQYCPIKEDIINQNKKLGE